MLPTSQLLMIRPAKFVFNTQTATSNYFQQEPGTEIHLAALAEFDAMAGLLHAKGVDVVVVQDSIEPPTPDAIFPNNWISFHENKQAVLYPMCTPNRRAERKPETMLAIKKIIGDFSIIDLTAHENHEAFLEGTGSMVLDREHRIAYACRSVRTNPIVLDEFCRVMHYNPVLFSAFDQNQQPVYHTNVMMCITRQLAIVCLDAISNESEKKSVLNSFAKTGKTIVPISLRQMQCFAGNMLQVSNKEGRKLMLMSSQAYHSLKPDQVHIIEQENEIVHSPLTNIESAGGGSARCMLAEIFV